MALTTTKQRRAIGERLAQERRRLNYTELQIAQLLGVQLEVYLQYESGEDDPGIFSMQRLYSIGFDVMFIITGDRYRPVHVPVPCRRAHVPCNTSQDARK